MKGILTVGLGIALAVAVPAGQAAAETTTFEFTEAVFNTCNDDLTVINGTERITSTVTQLRGGGIKVDYRDKKFGTGSGLTAKRYTYRNVFTDTFTTTAVGGLVSTRTSQFITLKKVGGPRSENMDVDATESIVFDATTGEVVSVKREFEAECE